MRKALFWLYQPYKWLFFYPYLVLSTIVFALAAIVLSVCASPRLAGFVGGVLWARLIVLFTPVFVRVSGRQHIASGQSYVIVSNHQSFYDIFILYGRLGMDIRWIMKKELGRIPALGPAARRVGHIFIDRSRREAALTLLNTVKSRLVAGTSVVFFPEGTRSRDGSLGPFQKGAFKIAVDCGLPILPITLVGTGAILPPGTMNLLPGRAAVVIHQPVGTAGCRYADIARLMHAARTAIEAGL